MTQIKKTWVLASWCNLYLREREVLDSWCNLYLRERELLDAWCNLYLRERCTWGMMQSIPKREVLDAWCNLYLREIITWCLMQYIPEREKYLMHDAIYTWEREALGEDSKFVSRQLWPPSFQAPSNYVYSIIHLFWSAFSPGAFIFLIYHFPRSSRGKKNKFQ